MKKLILATAALAFICAPALAGHGDYDHGKYKEKSHYMMKKMDKNGDGMVSHNEHQEFWHKMFHKADKNGDRALSKHEMKKAMKKHHKDMWEKDDKYNKKGKCMKAKGGDSYKERMAPYSD